jgi:hypothetical protein
MQTLRPDLFTRTSASFADWLFFYLKAGEKFVAELLSPTFFSLTAVIYTHESTG